MLKKAFYLSIPFLIFSCTSQKTKDNTTVIKTDMGIETTHESFAKTDANAQKEIKDWKEYQELNEFLNVFQKTSATEALNNALELKRLTQQLKDSSDIDILRIPALKARVNVFENEVLRLADMTYIPSISAKDVNAQVSKTLQLYGSLNSKINTIYLKKKFDTEINLDSLFKQ